MSVFNGLPRFIERWRCDQLGNVGMIFAFSFVGIVAFAGMGYDASRATVTRQVLQDAVDSAALGAAGIRNGTESERIAAASSLFQAIALKQGLRVANMRIVNGATTVTVSGTVNVPTVFMPLIGITNVKVAALAQAKEGAEPGASIFGSSSDRVCLLALDPNNTDGIHIEGNAHLSMPTCAGYADSGHSTSINANGAASVATAKGFCTVGGVSIPHNNFTPTPLTQCNAMTDPFATVGAYPSSANYVATFTPPTVSGSCLATSLVLKKGSYTLAPGRYCKGLKLMAQATVTLQPGVYIIDNGSLSLSSGASISGSNVLFYFNGSGAVLDIQGGANASLTGRASWSSYSGFLFMQNPMAAEGNYSLITGGGTLDFNGMLYMPTQTIEWRGNGDVNANSSVFGMIAKNFEMRGTGTLNAISNSSSSLVPDINPRVPPPPTPLVLTE